MSSITIITDTDSSLPADVAEQHGIRQVPINIIFDEETFLTGVDIDDGALFARVDREGKLPTTSAPTPGQFAEAYEAAFGAGADAIICYCVSSEISATYSAAVTARELMPARDITVIDSRNVAMALGFTVLAAAEAAAAGASRKEILAHATDVSERTHLFGALATLKYLAMSGRVGHLAAGMANLLNVKPILTIREGKLDMLERVRTRQKAWSRVIELAGETLAGRPVERLAIQHVNVPEDAEVFRRQLCAAIPCPKQVITAEFTAGLSVHTGVGIVSVTFVAGS